MFKIRQGCFETNSSSTHAIIVAAEKVEPFYFSVKFDIGEFGWEHDVLDSPDEKASYLYTAACELSDNDVYDELVEKLAPYGVSCYSTNRAQFKEYEGHKYLDNGYVDHSDECREFVDYMMADPERLVSFLFSDKFICLLCIQSAFNIRIRLSHSLVRHSVISILHKLEKDKEDNQQHRKDSAEEKSPLQIIAGLLRNHADCAWAN